MEQKSFTKDPASQGALLDWIKDNGDFRMKGYHKLVVIEESVFPRKNDGRAKKNYLICEDPDTQEKFIILKGLFTDLDDRYPDMRVLQPVEGSEEVVLNDKLVYSMTEEGQLDIAI